MKEHKAVSVLNWFSLKMMTRKEGRSWESQLAQRISSGIWNISTLNQHSPKPVQGSGRFESHLMTYVKWVKWANCLSKTARHLPILQLTFLVEVSKKHSKRRLSLKSISNVNNMAHHCLLAEKMLRRPWKKATVQIQLKRNQVWIQVFATRNKRLPAEAKTYINPDLNWF